MATETVDQARQRALRNLAVYFPFSLAYLCADCAVVFAAQRACPACGSSTVHPVEGIIRDRSARAYEAGVVAELEDLRVLGKRGRT